MALTYVNKGNSFVYNLQLGKKSFVEYTDGDRNELSSIGDFDDQPKKDDDLDQDEGEDAPEPENPPDAPDVPDDPEPVVPQPTPPSPEPQPEQPNVITIPQNCTAKGQKATKDYPARHVTTSTSGFCLSKWHSNFQKCIAYAKEKGVPLFYVWSNGNACGHCSQLKSALQNKIFKNYMAKTKILWCYTASCDSDAQRHSSFAYLFGFGHGGDSKTVSSSMKKLLKTYRAKSKSLIGQYPFVGLYWYNPYLKKLHYDIITVGDNVDDGFPGELGAKSAVKWLKSKVSKFKSIGKYDVTTATYTL